MNEADAPPRSFTSQVLAGATLPGPLPPHVFESPSTCMFAPNIHACNTTRHVATVGCNTVVVQHYAIRNWDLHTVSWVEAYLHIGDQEGSRAGAGETDANPSRVGIGELKGGSKNGEVTTSRTGEGNVARSLHVYISEEELDDAGTGDRDVAAILNQDTCAQRRRRWIAADIVTV